MPDPRLRRGAVYLLRGYTFPHEKDSGGAGVHYPIPLHRQPAYRREGYGDVHLPITEQVAAEVLSLPMYPELTETRIAYIAEAVKEFLARTLDAEGAVT